MLCHLRHDGPVVLFYNSLESVQGVSYGGICPHESVEASVNGFCSLLAVKPQSHLPLPYPVSHVIFQHVHLGCY